MREARNEIDLAPIAPRAVSGGNKEGLRISLNPRKMGTT